MIPGMVWNLFFVIAPIFFLVLMTFYKVRPSYGFDRIFTLDNYYFVFLENSASLLSVIWVTVQTSMIVTVASFLLAYPAAYFLCFKLRNPLLKLILLFGMVIPFWVNWLIRTIGWYPLLGYQGVINYVLVSLGILREPSGAFLFSYPPVLVVMVQSSILFMVGPIFLALSKIDHRLIEVAQSLGASKLSAFYHVVFRMSLPGVIAGGVFVFVTTIGDFPTPLVIGGGFTNTVGMVIDRYCTTIHWPISALFSIVAMLTSFIGVYLMLRIADVTELL